MVALRKVFDVEQDEIENNALAKAEFLSILAHKHRLHILFLLSKSEYSLSELTRELSETTVALSRHLMILRENNIIAGRRYGKLVRYSLISEKVRRMVEAMGDIFAALHQVHADEALLNPDDRCKANGDAQILASLFQNLYPPHVDRK